MSHLLDEADFQFIPDNLEAELAFVQSLPDRPAANHNIDAQLAVGDIMIPEPRTQPPCAARGRHPHPQRAPQANFPDFEARLTMQNLPPLPP